MSSKKSWVKLKVKMNPINNSFESELNELELNFPNYLQQRMYNTTSWNGMSRVRRIDNHIDGNSYDGDSYGGGDRVSDVEKYCDDVVDQNQHDYQDVYQLTETTPYLQFPPYQPTIGTYNTNITSSIGTYNMYSTHQMEQNFDSSPTKFTSSSSPFHLPPKNKELEQNGYPFECNHKNMYESLTSIDDPEFGSLSKKKKDIDLLASSSSSSLSDSRIFNFRNLEEEKEEPIKRDNTDGLGKRWNVKGKKTSQLQANVQENSELDDLIFEFQERIDQAMKKCNTYSKHSHNYLEQLMIHVNEEEKGVTSLWIKIQDLTQQIHDKIFSSNINIPNEGEISDSAEKDDPDSVSNDNFNIEDITKQREKLLYDLYSTFDRSNATNALKLVRLSLFTQIMQMKDLDNFSMKMISTVEGSIRESIEHIQKIKQQADLLTLNVSRIREKMYQLKEMDKDIKIKKKQYLKCKYEYEANEDELGKNEGEILNKKVQEMRKQYHEHLRAYEKLENEIISSCKQCAPHLYMELEKNDKGPSNIEEWLKKLGLLVQNHDYTIIKKWNSNIELVQIQSSEAEKVFKLIMNGKSAEREIFLLHKLKHPYIVPLEGVSVTKRDRNQNPTELALHMPYASNGTVWHWLYKKDPLFPITNLNEGRQRTVQEVKNIFRQIIIGISHIHAKNVIHRDIKPGNVLINEDGAVWISDFGISKQKTFESTTFLFSMPGTTRIGTERYMAPEIIHGEHPSSERSDMYSFGVMLYEALFQKSVQRDSQFDVIFPEISTNSAFDIVEDEAKDLIRELLCNDPRKRPTAVQVLCHQFFRKDQIEQSLTESREIVDSKTRIHHFMSYLRQNSQEKIDGKMIIIRRNHLVEDVIQYFSEKATKDELMEGISVHFEGETGIDAGGLTRDMFTQFFQQIFNEKYGLFCGKDVFVPTKLENCSSNLKKLNDLEIVGRLIGRCMMTDHTLFIRMHPLVYDFLILGYEAISKIQLFSSWMRQLKIYDRVHARSLKHVVDRIKMGTKPESLYLDAYFNDEKGKIYTLNSKTAELFGILDIKGYMGLCKNELSSWERLRKGFLLCGVNQQELKLLRGIELNIIINGAEELQGMVLLENIEFSGWDIVPNGPQIVQWFKQLILNDLNDGQLRRLLFWMTSLASIPFGGLPKKCVITPSDKSCMGHTCIYSLDVKYPGICSYDDLKNMILKCLEYVETSDTFD